VQFAALIHRYSVVGPDDLKATTQAGDRIVSIGNGTALGPGTVDVATNLPTIQFTAAATGATRWDLVVLRRDWQPPGGTSEIKIIEGGTTQGYPTIGTATNQWNRRPGIMDDQPLYLQQVNGTLLGTRIDLRVWGSLGAGFVANDDLVKTYLDRVGTEVRVGDKRWTYDLGANNVPQWNYTIPKQTTHSSPTIGTGFEAVTENGHKPRLVRNGNMIHLIGAVRRLTGEFSNMLTIPASFLPENASATFVGSGVSSNGIAYEMVIEGGVIKIPNGYASKTDTGSFTIFPITASWPIY
jgi:hypothetical protein